MIYDLLPCMSSGNDHHHRRNVQNLGKSDCDAKVVMKEVIYFKVHMVSTLYAKL